MNVPAIARKTFEELKDQLEYSSIVNTVVDKLSTILSSLDRARYVHQTVDEYNKEVFSHPLVMQFSPCKVGCDACCHTQVSVTADEAELLVQKINSGLDIPIERLRKQMSAGNDSSLYFNIPYFDRRCVFLSEEGSCRVYEDRPSVCRSNAVLGDADQCDTSEAIKPTRLIRTPKSDMVTYASFLQAKESGALPFLLGSKLGL
jgi:Fe-S-cluster containining protein